MHRQPARWTSIRLWQAAHAGFMDGWRTLDATRRRRFLSTLGGGLGAVLVLTAVLSLTAHGVLSGREAELEAGLVHAAGQASWPAFHKAVWLEEPGGSTLLIPLVLLAVWTCARLGRSLEALALAAAFVGAKPILFLGRLLFERERPDLIAGGIVSPTTGSFPSGHTLQAFAFWGVVAFLWASASGTRVERALAVVAWLTLAVVVAAARLRLGTHWPSDLLAGALLGTAWAAVIVVALRGARGSAPLPSAGGG